MATDDKLPEAPGLWARFVHWSYRNFSSVLYPKKAEICNCGADLGIQLPMAHLLERPDVARESKEWRMHMYGASLYLHMVSTPGAKYKEANQDLFKGKDILEVACMRGGGARYITEVVRPRRYLATDIVQEHVDLCHKLHTPVEGLEYALADALHLEDEFEPEEFDCVLCIQAAAQFADLGRFVEGAWHVLKPGGRLMIADSFTRDSLKTLLDACEDIGFAIDATADISRAVHAVGLCQIPKGLSYLRIVARKEE